VWNWRTGTALRIETQTDEGVTELAYSPPGELIAVGFGYPSGRIGLWDPRSGQARGQLTNQATVVTALAFSPDGRLLAASDVSQTIRLWHVPEQVERPCLRAYRGGVAALAFLPDGKTLLSGGNDGAVRLWDVTAPPRIRGHTNLVISYGYADRARVEPQGFAPGALLDPLAVCRFGFTFTPDGQSVLMPDKEGFIDVWQVRSVQRTDRLTLLGSNNWDVALSPDGRWLAAGKTTGTVTIWEWTARQAVTNFTIPFDWFGRVRFSRSGRFLLAGTVLGNYEAGNYKATWRIWRAGDWQEVPLPASLLEGLFAVDLSPDEHLLAGGYDNGAVRLWKFPAGLPQAAFTNYSGRVNGVLFSPDGQTLFSAGDDVQVRFWDVSARRELGPFAGLTGVYGVACSADGRRLVTGSGSVKDPVKLWDLATHRELLALQGQGTYFVGLSFSPDGNTLIGTTLSGIANFWRVPSWEDIRAVDHASGQTK
jgi:WD40 repeat protein